MQPSPALAGDLARIPEVHVRFNVRLSDYTRFGIGGPAAVYAETASESGLVQALRLVQASDARWVVIGDGTNLIVADAGFPGVVLRFTNKSLRVDGERVHAAAGTVLQSLVDFTLNLDLAGIHTMTGIPGCVGAAVYGNAGAYGRSISQSVREVWAFDGSQVRTFSNDECAFHYRESVFKHNKSWIIFSTVLDLQPGDGPALRQHAATILDTRNRKYPPSMKCAGSIFKNLLLAELPAAAAAQVPPRVIIEGKVPSAYFLEQVGAKGLSEGDIRVADYHANLIYNAGDGTAAQLRNVIAELKRRVAGQFGLDLEEEVQYVGFES